MFHDLKYMNGYLLVKIKELVFHTRDYGHNCYLRMKKVALLATFQLFTWDYQNWLNNSSFVTMPSFRHTSLPPL